MLFANSKMMGTFKGFIDKGLEFAADIVAPYDSDMLDKPQLGQFILIELASEEEASLGRITKLIPGGLLASSEGEDYMNTMQRRQQAVPEDLKQQRLKYKVQVKLLGAVKVASGKVIYIPSQRRLPHLGAKVALPSAVVLQELCKLSRGTTELGDYVLGEFVYCGAGLAQAGPEMRSVDPKLTVSFDIKNLVSRRSVVFARAGYGKSNLIKYLVSELYKEQPKTLGGLPVGTLIFDADGEYFWPDKVRHRPGLCDVPHLADKLVVFTNRPLPSPYYGSWKVGEVKLDIRELSARDVVGVAISPDKQSNQNVIKLKGVGEANWRELVDLVHARGLQVSDADMGRLLGYAPPQIQGAAAEIAGARSNMASIVHLLHDPMSNVLAWSIEGLREGKIVVLDISLLSSSAGNMIAGLLMRKIFSHNQQNFTGGMPIVPVVAAIEEAQSVLGKNLEESSPFVEWVKEGRKYELGSILVTQQPASLAPELLSQSDNWFTFHLLSEGDAGTLGKYNSHFSHDILAHLIAEPISGNCYMWSAPHQPFVLPVRIRSFEGLYGANIKQSETEPAIPNSPAEKVIAAVAERLERLKQGLVNTLKLPKVKFYRVPNGLGNGVAGAGVKAGQLYYLIQELRTDVDTQSDAYLKNTLLGLILGADKFRKYDGDEGEFFCAAEADWNAALGKTIKLSDLA